MTTVVIVKQGQKLTEAEVVAHCSAHMAGSQAPKRVVFAGQPPKSPSGKVLKRRLREQLVLYSYKYSLWRLWDKRWRHFNYHINPVDAGWLVRCAQHLWATRGELRCFPGTMGVRPSLHLLRSKVCGQARLFWNIKKVTSGKTQLFVRKAPA